MTTTEKPSLYGLALEQHGLQARISELSERLHSEDEAEAAEALAALENLLAVEEGNREALMAKADAYCWVIDQLRGQAAWRSRQANRLMDLAEQDERKAEKLQETLVRILTTLQPDETRFELPEHRISSRKSQAVEIEPGTEAYDLPQTYQRVKTTVAADKTALLRDLKAGAVVPGVRLVERRSWKIG
jgi:hypothetical protein